MKGFMDDRVLHDMKRAGEEAVKAQMITGSFITNLNSLVESKQLKKENLAAASNISERTLWRLRTDESYVPTLQTLLAVCVGMKLNFSESMILIEMSPHRLRHTMYQDGIYAYILRHNFDMEVDEINIYLSELGCRKLGNSM